MISAGRFATEKCQSALAQESEIEDRPSLQNCSSTVAASSPVAILHGHTKLQTKSLLNPKPTRLVDNKQYLLGEVKKGLAGRRE